MSATTAAGRTHFAVGPELRSGATPGSAINADYLADEETLVRRLADAARLPGPARAAIQSRALELVEAVRASAGRRRARMLSLREYSLASPEGVILMCLAEALLRIPDGETADRLIADKIPEGAWSEHLGDSESLLVNASTWGLMLTGKVVALEPAQIGTARAWYSRLVTRLGEPIARAALKQAMRILGHQFVMGRNIEEALERADGETERRYRYSFDMLGEAALTAGDAAHYLEKYAAAIRSVAQRADPLTPLMARHGISVKLSALHPRYEIAQRARVLAELTPRLEELLRLARHGGVALTVDAEEAERLELSLEIIDRLLASEVTRDFAGFGLAVQAYQRRAPAVIDWLARSASQARATSDGAPGEGRLLGQRDQTSTGARLIGLSGVHPQVQHRCLLSRLRAAARRGDGCHLCAVCDSTTRTRLPSWRSCSPRAPHTLSFSDCMGWARSSISM